MAIIKTVALVFLIFGLYCVQEYNPYNDFSNAKIVVADTGSAWSDTLEIFNTYKLTLAVAFAELIDSFSLSFTGNRLWHDTIIIPQVNHPYTFHCSFSSPGNVSMTSYIWLKNKTKDTLQKYYYVKSPLLPDSVMGFCDAPVIVSTKGVADKDILYHWDFDKSYQYETQRLIDTIVVFTPLHGRFGKLSVREKNGLHSSPAAFFYFSILDTIHPVILCKNSNLSNDTIKTGETSFTFMAQIYDQGNRRVDSASVCNAPFTYFDPEGLLYAARFENMKQYTKTLPLELNVVSIDHINNEFDNNSTRKTFWAYYDQSTTQDKVIRITIKGIHDTAFTPDSIFYVNGEIWNFTIDTLLLQATLNNTLIQKPSMIPPQSTSYWYKILKLSQKGKNDLVVYATGKNAPAPLASESRIIFYDPDLIDTTGPVIAGIFVNDSIYVKNNPRIIIGDSTVIVSVKAYDKSAAITAVLIDNLKALSIPAEFLWTRKNVPLSHDPQHTIFVKVSDDSGYTAEASFVIIYNKKPGLDSINSFMKQKIFEVGKSYYDTMYTFDPDKDFVLVYMIYNTKWKVNGSSLSLIPAIADTGKDSMRFALFDGYEYSDTITWSFTIIPKTDTTTPVSFIQGILNSLPDALTARRDTLSFAINQNSATGGKKPYLFTIALTGKTDTTLVDKMAQAAILWIPQQKDTGIHQIRLTVQDSNQASHTLYHQVTVNPALSNNPSLTTTKIWLPAHDTTPVKYKDTLTLRPPDSALLIFTIIDTVRGLKHYKVTLQQSQFINQYIVNQNQFTHCLIYNSKIVSDSLTVTVENAGRNEKAAPFKVYMKYRPVRNSISESAGSYNTPRRKR
jgi:hypothetical protein